MSRGDRVDDGIDGDDDDEDDDAFTGGGAAAAVWTRKAHTGAMETRESAGEVSTMPLHWHSPAASRRHGRAWGRWAAVAR